MIQALIFDFGGVLMRTVDPTPRRAWERRLGLPPTGIYDFTFDHPLWDEVQLGRLSMAEFWADIGQQLGLDDRALAELRHDFFAGDQLDEELVALIRHYRAEGYRTGLLSNAPAGLSSWLERLGIADAFDVRVISGCEGVMKPEPRIFQVALERLGVAPDEAVLVDDSHRNVAAAQALGMHTVRFRSIPHLRRSLQALGLPVTDPPPQPAPDIRAVIFDWGGVLAPLTFWQHIGDWEGRFGLEPGQLGRILWGPVWKQLEVGGIAQEEYDRYVADSLGLPDQEAVRQFYGEFYAGETLEPTVVAAVRTLRGRYRVGLLTNSFPRQEEFLRARFGFDPHAEFDAYVNSAEVGLAKPDPAIYHLILDRLEVAPEQAVLVDDMLRNVDGARAVGLHGIVFTDVESGLAELEALLGILWER